MIRPNSETEEMFGNTIDGFTGEPIPPVRTIEMNLFEYALNSNGKPVKTLLEASKGNIYLFWKDMERLKKVIINTSDFIEEKRPEEQHIVNYYPQLTLFIGKAERYMMKLENQRFAMKLLRSHLGMDKEELPRQSSPVPLVPIEGFLNRIRKKKEQIPNDLNFDDLFSNLKRMDDEGDYFKPMFTKRVIEKDEPIVSIFRIVNHIFQINNPSEDGNFPEVIRARYNHLEDRCNRLRQNLAKIAQGVQSSQPQPVKSSSGPSIDFPKDIANYDGFERLKRLEKDILEICVSIPGNGNSDKTSEEQVLSDFFREKSLFQKIVHENEKKIALTFLRIMTQTRNSSSNQRQPQPHDINSGIDFLKLSNSINNEVVSIEKLYDCLILIIRLPYLIRLYQNEIHTRNDVRQLFRVIDMQLEEFKKMEFQKQQNLFNNNKNDSSSSIDIFCQEMMMQIMNMGLIIRTPPNNMRRREEVVDVMKKYYRGIRDLESSRGTTTTSTTAGESLNDNSSYEDLMMTPMNQFDIDEEEKFEDEEDNEVQMSQKKMLLKESEDVMRRSRKANESAKIESDMDNVLKRFEKHHLNSSNRTGTSSFFEVPHIPVLSHVSTTTIPEVDTLKKEISKLRKENLLLKKNQQQQQMMMMMIKQQQQQKPRIIHKKMLVVESPEKGDVIGFERINDQLWKMISPYDCPVYLSRKCVQEVLMNNKKKKNTTTTTTTSIKLEVFSVKKINSLLGEDPLMLKRWKKIYFFVEGKIVEVCQTKDNSW